MNVYTSAMTKEPYEAVHHLKLTKTQKVLSFLFIGLEVKLGEYTIRLFQQNDGGYCPGVVSNSELICGLPDLSFSNFSKMCEELTDEEVLTYTMNYSLNVMKMH